MDRPKLNFRNYQPLTNQIKESAIVHETGNVESMRQEINDVEDQVKQFAKDAIEIEANKPKELDLLNLAVR